MEDLVKLARDDFYLFCLLMDEDYKQAEHLKLINNNLIKSEAGFKKLIINTPPRSGKTLTISILFPAWFLGRNPYKFSMVATYSEEAASGLRRSAFDLMCSDKYLAIFPKSGGYYACSQGSSTLGKHLDLIIIDDLQIDHGMHKGLFDWVTAQVFTRLKPNSSVVVVESRIDKNDLSGYLLKNMPKEWEHLT